MLPIDRHKDQTLFLSQIPQAALQHTMFPLGEMTKDVVKKLAENSGLEKIAKKREVYNLLIYIPIVIHTFYVFSFLVLIMD